MNTNALVRGSRGPGIGPLWSISGPGRGAEAESGRSRLHRSTRVRLSLRMNRTNGRQAPSIGLLWGLPDVAAYVGCADATALTKMAGFPPALKLPGVRGSRWFPTDVTAFFESLTSSAVSSKQDDENRPTLRPIIAAEMRDRVRGA
jgi:hypothetical protein